MTAWRNAAKNGELRFSVEVDSDLPKGSAPRLEQAAREAACQLFALPWELLHDDRGYLFQGAQPVGVRRRLPQRRHEPGALADLPIRVLLVSPRPEDQSAAFIDHRASARPLVAAVEGLGDLAELSVLAPPTLPALRQALDDAHSGGRRSTSSISTVTVSLAASTAWAALFRGSRGSRQTLRPPLEARAADELAGLVRDHRIPVMFLEACQTAHAEHDIAASVAGRLLQEGVTSVVAMSHSVPAETAQRFVGAFYSQLSQGATVGRSMLAGQTALADDRPRGQIPGAGPSVSTTGLSRSCTRKTTTRSCSAACRAKRRGGFWNPSGENAWAALARPAASRFIGRSRELLALERLLTRQRPRWWSAPEARARRHLPSSSLAGWFVPSDSAAQRSCRLSTSRMSGRSSTRSASSFAPRDQLVSREVQGRGGSTEARRKGPARRADDPGLRQPGEYLARLGRARLRPPRSRFPVCSTWSRGCWPRTQHAGTLYQPAEASGPVR